MKSAKSLQIHSHNIFSRLLSKEYGVYQQFIYTVMASSESKIEALRFEKYEQACWDWNTRAFEMNAILDIWFAAFRLVPNFSLEGCPMGLPWWLSGKESFCQCRRHWFEPWSGKIPHAAEQLSPCTITLKSGLQRLRTSTIELMCYNY